MHSPISTDASLGQRIKSSTWDLHQRAEHDLLPQHMARGSMPRPAYLAMLGQQFLAQRVLDEAIRQHRAAVPALAALIDDAQFQAPYLAADLLHWGVPGESLRPLPGTAAMIARIDQATAEPIRLLGYHYVREGANNGNRFIAMKLRKSWGLPHDQRDGFRYLDPYGDQQRPRWEAFKVALDAQTLGPADAARVIEAARSMFEMVMAMHVDHDLPPLDPAPVPSHPTHA